MATSDLLVWVDCEMTGLDLINDELIEVAALVTDADLNVLGDGVDLVIKPSHQGAGADGRLRTRHARGLRPAQLAGRRIVHGRGRAARPRLCPRPSWQSPARLRSPATRSAPIGHSWRATCRPSNVTFTTAASTSPASRSWYAAGTPRVLPGTGQGRQPSRARRCPRVHRGAAVLPRGGLRATAWTGQCRSQGDCRSSSGRADGGGSCPGLNTPTRQDPGRYTSRCAVWSAKRVWASRMVGVAQLVEPLVVVQDVAGSSPVTHPTEGPEKRNPIGERSSRRFDGLLPVPHPLVPCRSRQHVSVQQRWRAARSGPLPGWHGAELGPRSAAR